MPLLNLICNYARAPGVSTITHAHQAWAPLRTHTKRGTNVIGLTMSSAINMAWEAPTDVGKKRKAIVVFDMITRGARRVTI